MDHKVNDTSSHYPKDHGVDTESIIGGKATPETCCQGSECGCDGSLSFSPSRPPTHQSMRSDGCLDELARALCADDEDRFHSNNEDNQSLASEDTCKCDDGKSR